MIINYEFRAFLQKSYRIMKGRFDGHLNFVPFFILIIILLTNFIGESNASVEILDPPGLVAPKYVCVSPSDIIINFTIKNYDNNAFNGYYMLSMGEFRDGEYMFTGGREFDEASSKQLTLLPNESLDGSFTIHLRSNFNDDFLDPVVAIFDNNKNFVYSFPYIKPIYPLNSSIYKFRIFTGKCMNFTIEGYIYDTNTKKAIDGATVALANVSSSYKSSTDINGHYKLSINNYLSAYNSIEYSKPGYNPAKQNITLQADQNIRLNFSLEPEGKAQFKESLTSNISDVTWPDNRSYVYNESVEINVKVLNAATQANSFWVGYSVQDSSGKWWDAPPKQTASIPLGESDSIQLKWQPLAESPQGAYNATVALWQGYDNSTKLMKGELDRRTKNNAFRLSRIQPTLGGVEPAINPIGGDVTSVKNIESDIIYETKNVPGYTLKIYGPKKPLVNKQENYKILLEKDEAYIKSLGKTESGWRVISCSYAYPDDRVNAYPTDLRYKKSDGTWRQIDPANDFDRVGFWQEWAVNAAADKVLLIPGLLDIIKNHFNSELPTPPQDSPFYNANDYDTLTINFETFLDSANADEYSPDKTTLYGTTPYMGVDLILPMMFTKSGNSDLNFFFVLSKPNPYQKSSFESYDAKVVVSARESP